MKVVIPNFRSDSTISISSIDCGSSTFTLVETTNIGTSTASMLLQLATATVTNGNNCKISTTGWKTPLIPEIANATSRTIEIISSLTTYNNIGPVGIVKSPAITAVQMFSRNDGDTLVLWDTLTIFSLQSNSSCFTIDNTAPLCHSTNANSCTNGMQYDGTETTITIYKNQTVKTRGCFLNVDSLVYDITFPNVICAAGTFSPTGYSRETNDCKLCNNGTYLDDAGTSAALHDEEIDCKRCELGKSLLDMEFSTLNHDDPSDCITCSAGRYADFVGSPICTNCSVGTYLIDQGTIAQLHSIACQCQ